MSHDATNWAIKQKGLKPATKIVLWHLCDRFHPDQGCFPSLDTLAEDCEMSRRSVQDHIAELEKVGLISVEKMPRRNGQLPRNRYILAFETLGQNLPKAKSALGNSEPSPLANPRKSLGQNLPTNSVKGTSKRTSKDTGEAVACLAEVIGQDLAVAFDAHRKAKRSPLTTHAAELIAKELKGHPDPVAVIEKTIMQGWTGVFFDAAPAHAPAIPRIRAQLPKEARQ